MPSWWPQFRDFQVVSFSFKIKTGQKTPKKHKLQFAEWNSYKVKKLQLFKKLYLKWNTALAWCISIYSDKRIQASEFSSQFFYLKGFSFKDIYG